MKFWSVTTQVKVIEQCFPVLFIMLWKVVQTFESVDEILECDHSTRKAIKDCFPMIMLIMLYKHINQS